MTITLAVISPKGLRLDPVKELVAMYLQRSTKYIKSQLETFPSESALLEALTRRAGRTPAHLVVADSRGEQVTSEQLAASLDRVAAAGLGEFVVAIGPADGWSPIALTRANQSIAFGRITLPHELAAAVAAEQIYRALTIRAGHPYHSGH